MNYWIRTIPFLLILEQGLLGSATQATIKSAAGLFIMHNRIASALFNFQVMIAECLGFSLLPISNALYIFSHTYFLPLSVPTPWILSQVIPSDHTGNWSKGVNSRGESHKARVALASYQVYRELHLLIPFWKTYKLSSHWIVQIFPLSDFQSAHSFLHC